MSIDQTTSASVRSAVQTLAQRQALRETLDELAARDTPTLVLKGHALSQWLYAPTQQRATADVDLLLPRRTDVDGLVPWLAAHGFDALDGGFAGDMVCFERACRGTPGKGPPVEIDLHWRLSTLPVFAFRFEFAELMAGSQPLPALHPHARGLGPAHALLHACMHRVQNMADGTHNERKWLRDIELMIERLTSAQWEEVVDLAVTRKLAAVLADGLEAAGRSGTDQAPPAVMFRLQHAATVQGMRVHCMHRWSYIQWQCWRAIPTLRLRLRWLRQRLWPALPYLRHRHGALARSNLGLRGVRIVSALRQAAGRRRRPAE